MNIAWDRKSHNWDDEIILRTMMLGDDENIRDMYVHVQPEKLKTVFHEKHGQLDRKSQIFWGYKLGIKPNNPPFTHHFYVSSTPSRDITA